MGGIVFTAIGNLVAGVCMFVAAIALAARAYSEWNQEQG